MVKKNPMRRVYWIESPKHKVAPWQKCMIPESRNLLRTILSLKHEEIIKKRETLETIHQKEEEYCSEKIFEHSLSDSNEGFGLHQSKIVPKMMNSNQIKTNKMRDFNEWSSEEQFQEFPSLFTKLLQNIVKRTQNIKNKLKIEKGLSIDKQFIPENFHICQYCGRKFLKPCSLGGHISKLHPEKRKREKEQIEMPEWDYETPVRRK